MATSGNFFKNSVFVRTKDLRNIQREGSITVDIPILGTSQTFGVTYVDNHDKGGYSWSGSSIINGLENAKLNMHYINQEVFGTLETEDRYFRLKPGDCLTIRNVEQSCIWKSLKREFHIFQIQKWSMTGKVQEVLLREIREIVLND